MKKKHVYIFLRRYSNFKNYFSALEKELKNNYEITVVHNSHCEEGKKYTDNKSAIDIGIQGIDSLRESIKRSDVKLLIITNIRSLIDYSIIRLFSDLGIPILYVEHGILLSKSSNFKKKNIFNSLYRYYKYIIYFVLIVNDILRTPSALINAFKVLRGKKIKIKLDYALLYSKRSKRYLESLIELNETKIKYSGYPIVKTNEELKHLKNIATKKQIVYIHQPLVIDNYSHYTLDNEVKRIQDLKILAEKNGFSFILKLHPRDDLEYYNASTNDIKIIYDEVDTQYLIAESEIVLGHFSTALFTAAYLNKRIFILDYLRLKIKIEDIFYTFGKSIKSEHQLENCLNGSDNKPITADKTISDIIGIHNNREHRFKMVNEFLRI